MVNKNNELMFDGFVVLAEHNKVIGADTEYKLEPKIMQVLCFLMENHGEVYSRESIAEALWPGTVTGLEVVTRAIFELRKTLKDDAKSPKYIETIPRKGYCFVYPLEYIDEQPRQLIIERKYIWLLVLFLMCFALILFYSNSQSNETYISEDYQASLLTHSGNDLSAPAISPTSKYVVYIEKRIGHDGHDKLVLLDLKTQKRQEIVKTTGQLKSPAWTYKTNDILYILCINEKCEIRQFDIENQANKLVLKVNENLLYLAFNSIENIAAIGLLSDGKREISFANLNEEKVKFEYLKTNLNHIGKPLFSEDGQSLFFVSWVDRKVKKLFRYDLATKRVKEVDVPFEIIMGLSNKDNDSLWVSGRVNGKSSIWEYSINDDFFVKTFDSEPGAFLTDLTSDDEGDLLIYKNLKRNINIENIGLSTLDIAQDINSHLIDMNAVFSAQNNTLYFASNRTGLYELWSHNTKELIKLTELGAQMIERPIISSSGDFLAFVSQVNSNFYLNIYDLNKQQIISTDKLKNKTFLLSWSADNRRLYTSVSIDGDYSIYSFDSLTKKHKKIILDAGLIAQEHNKAGELYYGNIQTRTLMLKKENGELINIYSLPDNAVGLMPHQTKVIGNKLYYVGYVKGSKGLYSYAFDTQEIKLKYDLPDGAYVTQIGKGLDIWIIYDYLTKDHAQLVRLQKH